MNGKGNSEHSRWMVVSCKGVMDNRPGEDEPSITVIGSSNYTKRAYSCDLESNAIIITKDKDLKMKMKHRN